ncbi:small subunit processome component 20 homolog isoform X2 [Vigna umbellata]|uniref:small subunit processome component 20 homolog isoform X2 n=1 Tax=Vigna umbellata TaxID=87088 RepID=UPI001F5FD439|nr:small subunit processome component 20 homolog isoform X2 [Vigna umbellata]
MATASHARAVKSLNKSSGRGRFVFKSFSERVNEIDINVYRSLEKVKAEPSEGSSFFRDCLIEWRELNTAEDFISFYEEIMPYTQTLPLVLLHKESLILKLLSRLHIKARLSVDAILSLIAALSRDLLEEFVPLLPRIVESLVSLLENGGEREPDIIEQIFMSWSYIMMYLQKYLVRNPSEVLRVTSKLRYYPNKYVRQFMGEAMSFVLRNAPDEQLERGISRLIDDAVKKPSLCREGVEALLFNIMKGSTSRFHSKAERVLQLLTSEAIYPIGDKVSQDSMAIVKIVKSVFKKLCEKMESKELNLVWNCLYKETDECLNTGNIRHLQYTLSVLVSAIKVQNGQKVSDYKPVLKLALRLVQTFTKASGVIDSQDMDLVVDRILKLMLAILKGLCNCNTSMIPECALQWAPIFKSGRSSLLSFIRKLLHEDLCLFHFRSNVISAMNDLMEISEEEVIHLLQSFCEKMQLDILNSDLVDGTSEEAPLARVCSRLQKIISCWKEKIIDIARADVLCEIDEGMLAHLWGAVNCYSHMCIVGGNPSLMVELMDALDHLLNAKAGYIGDMSKRALESIIGAALSSYNRLCNHSFCGADETEKFLSLAKRYKLSPPVLLAVADYLEFNSSLENNGCRIYNPELEEKTADAVAIFSDNLNHSDKEIRISTLKILSHCKPLVWESSSVGEAADMKKKTEVSPTSNADFTENNALLLLLSLETTPISISTSRSIQLLISKIQMKLSAGRIPNVHVPLVLNGLLGVLNNRFSHLWNPVLECIAVLISVHLSHVWDSLVDYIEKCQAIFLTPCNLHASDNGALFGHPAGLLDRFKFFVCHASDSTPTGTILVLLLQALQKIPAVIEPHSRQFIPLFLKFLGYNTLDLASVGLFDSVSCEGKEWKTVLKEWLNLLKLMKNPKSFYCGQFLKGVLQNRLLEENDPEIQMRVLDCLLIWKDDYVLPYIEHLRNLINSKNLREELTTWSLSRESEYIEECHRAYLVPLVIRLLMPRVRKLKGLASRKKASICHRKAILSFVAGVDVIELPLFFALLIKPLQIVKKTDGPANLFWTLPTGSINEFQDAALLEYFTFDNIANLSWKKKYGFLHVIEDIVAVFDELHIRPFLDLLVGCVVRLLESCTLSLSANLNRLPSEQHNCSPKNSIGEDSVPTDQIKMSGNLNQLKDMRSLCLKIISLVLNKYEDHEFCSDWWDKFFSAVKPLIEKFKQETASSEKPSSLLSCFTAMSANNKLVALLCWKESLVPDIFSIISVNSASETVVYCVLKFVENLLNLDNQFNGEDNAAQTVLLSNVEVLMDSMCCLFGRDNAVKRKLIKSPGETVIRIFKFLPKYIRDAELAKQFVDILLLFMEKNTQNSDVWVEVLQVIQNILPTLGHESTTKILRAVSPLYISAELDMRLRICDLLDALVASNASILPMAKLLRQLNTTSTLGWLDHDAILDAYGIINIDFFGNVQVEQALLILSHCVHDMSSEETTFMCSALSSLLSFVDFSALILHQEENSEEHMSVTKNTDNCWTKSCIQRVAKKFLLKHMADAMDGSLSVIKGWIKLLHQMVLKLPEVSNLKSLMALCNEDGEAVFFDNISDSVIRKRVKALSWFRNVVSVNKLSEFITEKVFLRLFFNMLFDEKEEKAEHMKNACIETIASVAGQMGWKSYNTLLIRCLRGASSSSDKQKLFIRLICCILDKFHFYDKEPKEPLDGVSGIEMRDTDVNKEIQTCLCKNVLPKIQKLLDSESEKVNVNISLAALKLLKLLPGDVMDLYLPTIVHRISNFLKSHLESIRDEARSALATCLKELGLEYLQFIVKVLQSTLKRGYELHVLGYTLNFILSKCLSTPVVGKIDYCLEDLLSVIENDILGDVGDQKEVEKIASKMKETRKKKSLESLKFVAQNITFKSYALKLLAPVTSHLQKHITPNVKGKLESMLHHMATGIESNPSVDQTDLFIFIYGIVEDGLKDEISWHDNKLLQLEDKVSHVKTKRISKGPVVAKGLLCSHLITVFGLRIFHKRMKSLKQDAKDENTLSLLDPFVKLLCDCLSSKYEDILSISLLCLAILVRLPLPSLQQHAERLKASLLDIAQGSVSSSSPLMQSCLKLQSVLLRNTKISLTSDQINSLIHLPIFLDIEKNPSLDALSLLKGIVSRKLVVPEIYDLVTRVAELMVTSQIEAIRKKCSKIFLQFLLDYRLSEKRLQQHLDFLLLNLGYEHSTGRESLLEMIHAIIVKFPKSALDEQSNILFLHLVVCLANDDDNIVRSMAETAIKKLVSSVSPNSFKSILDCGLSWYLEGKQQLCGAQVLGLLIEVKKKGFREHTNSILPVTKHIFRSAIDAVTNRKEGFSDESVIPLWKEAYYSLVMLEKMINQFGDLCFAEYLEDIWEAICEMLLHPHSRVRNISVRLIALYFAHVTDASRENHGTSLRSYFIMSPSRLFLIATSLCCQLKMPLINDSDSSLMTQIFIFAICGVHSLMGQSACIDPPAFWSTLSQQEKDQFLKAFNLLDSRKGRSMFISSSTASIYEHSNQLNVDSAQRALVSLLLKKMGKIALQMDDAIQSGIVFNSFGSIMAQISQDDRLYYAHVILLPLYKVCEGFAGKVVIESVKKLAEDTCRKLENILGTHNFVQVYNHIRKNLMLKRNKRRQEEKQMAVINPMRNAKRRLRISAKNRANKKRKIMKLKESFRAGIKPMRNPKRKLRVSAENHANKKRKNL